MMNQDSLLALEADGVEVFLGGRKIVQNCSFKVGRGEFVGVIGPNGAGKSTLMKSLRGMLPLAAGNVRVFGRPVHLLENKAAARLMAYMQQEVNVGFGFTALEVVLAGRYAYLPWWRNESEQDHVLARKYLAFTGTEELANKPVNQVSGGERQRILLAKVLAQETPLIFLDEPTASLDLTFQEEIFRYCQAICAAGKTVILIAHDIRLAAKFCSRLILLADGKIVADGSPEQVITAENLEQAFGLHSAVFINQVTGNLDIHTYAAPAQAMAQKTVHVIGGGGTTGAIMRALYEQGCQLTIGVLQAGDSDAKVALAFEAEIVMGPSFCEIGTEQARLNRSKIAAADLVVLGNLCYGQQNLDNLRAAFAARNLIILEDTAMEDRDYTGGTATTLYRQLLRKPQVKVIKSEEFLAAAAELAAALRA